MSPQGRIICKSQGQLINFLNFIIFFSISRNLTYSQWHLSRLKIREENHKNLQKSRKSCKNVPSEISYWAIISVGYLSLGWIKMGVIRLLLRGRGQGAGNWKLTRVFFYRFIRFQRAFDLSVWSVCDQDRSDRMIWDQKEFECITWFDKRLLIYFMTQREIEEEQIQLQGGSIQNHDLKLFVLDQTFILNRFEWSLPDLNHWKRLLIMKIPTKPHPRNLSREIRPRNFCSNFRREFLNSFSVNISPFNEQNDHFWLKFFNI